MHFPKGLHLRLRWQCLSRLQFKAEGPDFQAELIPVHSPLLRESYLVSYPPLTYMLKFSGFADLASCLEVKVGANAGKLRSAASQSRETGQTLPIHCEVRRRLTHALHASSSAPPSHPITRKEGRERPILTHTTPSDELAWRERLAGRRK